MRRPSEHMTLACIVLVCLCGPFFSGCGGAGGSDREMGTVTGKVTLNGEPLDGGRVIFAHVEGPSAVADIQPDGTYSVEAAVGETKVSIDHRADPKPDPSGHEGMLAPGKSLVPEQYADANTSGLSLEIQPGENTYDIEMTE